MKAWKFMGGAALIFLLASGTARAENYVLTIKDHHFSPASLEIPAGQKVKITVDNQDPTVEEFESYELNREKVVSGNGKISVFIGPLDPGQYPYFGDFHKDLANGRIVAK